MEQAFIWFRVKTVLSETKQNLMDVLDRFRDGIREYQDIVQVYHHESVNQVREHDVDELLKICWGIAEPEGHDKVLVVTIACSESGFPLVAGSNAYQVVSPPKIKLGEKLGIADLVKKNRYQRERVSVFNGDLIHPTVIHTGP